MLGFGQISRLNQAAFPAGLSNILALPYVCRVKKSLYPAIRDIFLLIFFSRHTNRELMNEEIEDTRLVRQGDLVSR